MNHDEGEVSSESGATGRVLNIGEQPLKTVVAHGGEGKILFNRLFEESDFRTSINFVDYAVLPPGASIGRHRHGDNEEIYLVLEGQGRMELEGDVFTVEAGHVIVNKVQGTHGLKNVGDTELRLFVVEVAL